MENEDIRIRVADDGEDLNAYRTWLPQAFLSKPRPSFFLAEKKEGGDVVGLGSLRLLGNKIKNGRFQLYVEPEYRRKGIGSQLMRCMIDYTKSHGGSSVLAGLPAKEGDEAMKFFDSLDGFEIKRSLHHFEIKVADAWEYIGPLAKRLLEKGKKSQDYEIVTLAEAKPRLIYRLVLQHLGGIPESLVSRLRSGPDQGGFLPKLSVVIRSAEGPVAVLLVRRGKNGLVIDTRVVAPKARGTWVNVALMYTLTKNLREMNVEKVYFEGDDHLHKDTLKLAEKYKGKLILENHLYGCDFEKNDAAPDGDS